VVVVNQVSLRNRISQLCFSMNNDNNGSLLCKLRQLITEIIKPATQLVAKGGPSHVRRRLPTLFKFTCALLVTFVRGINEIAFIDNGWLCLAAENMV